MEREQNEEKYFTNEITMNEYTIREISFGIWKYKAGRNKLPVVIYLLAVFLPVICALVTGNEDYTLLTGLIGLAGLVCLLVYAGIVAYSEAKKREKCCGKRLKSMGRNRSLKLISERALPTILIIWKRRK